MKLPETKNIYKCNKKKLFEINIFFTVNYKKQRFENEIVSKFQYHSEILSQIIWNQKEFVNIQKEYVGEPLEI